MATKKSAPATRSSPPRSWATRAAFLGRLAGLYAVLWVVFLREPAVPTALDALVYVTPWNRGGYDAVLQHARRVRYASPCAWHAVSPDLEVVPTGEPNATWLAAMRDHATHVVPRYTLSDQWTQQDLVGFVADPRRGAQLGHTLRDHIDRMGYDGAVLELGGALPAHAIATLIQAAQAMHPRLAFLVIPPQGFGNQHFRAVAPHFAGFSLMTYDYSSARGGLGPNAPLDWVRDAALAVCGAECAKVHVGLNFYGMRDGPEPVVGAQVQEMLGTTSPSALCSGDGGKTPGQWACHWDPHIAEHRFTNGTHTIWYPTAQSVRERVALIRQLGARVSVWEAGQGLEELWKEL